MSRKPNYFKKITSLLNELHRRFPNQNIGKHIATAIDGSDLWALSDKDLFLALQSYKEELEIASPFTDDDQLQEIINDGLNLASILDEDNGEDY